MVALPQVPDPIREMFRAAASNLSIRPPKPGRPTLDRFIEVMQPAFENSAASYAYTAILGDAVFVPDQTKPEDAKRDYAWHADLDLTLQPNKAGMPTHRLNIHIVNTPTRYEIIYSEKIQRIKFAYGRKKLLSSHMANPLFRQELKSHSDFVMGLINIVRPRKLHVMKPRNHSRQ